MHTVVHLALGGYHREFPGAISIKHRTIERVLNHPTIFLGQYLCGTDYSYRSNACDLFRQHITREQAERICVRLQYFRAIAYQSLSKLSQRSFTQGRRVEKEHAILNPRPCSILQLARSFEVLRSSPQHTSAIAN